MAKRDHDYLFKIFLIGDSAVGKTTILRKFACPDEILETNYISTVGIDFKIKNIEIGDKKIKLQIWDTAGQERFHSITKSFYRHAKGILLVYDVTNSSSFDNISKWLRNVKELADEDVLKTLVGNKCDLDNLRAVSTDRGAEAAEKYNIPFIETSALKEINIKKLFYDMARTLVENEEKSEYKDKTPNGLDIKKDVKTNDIQSTCCSYSYKKWF